MTAKTLTHAFVSSRLDYCNSLMYGISDGLAADELQTVQNAAARVVTGARKFDRITPVLRQLHCLPVRQHLQVGDDHLQMHSRSDAVLPGWRVYPRFLRRRRAAAAVSRQRDTRRAVYKDRSARLCCVGPCDMEQLPRRSADLLTETVLA